ncbi:unnamed protein product [Dibothriocephalus latus]|uniref:Uncharacterized protein n=1 Tax=Dibothriocephalus latus TaxID=60516 RepID=A0A3P7NAB7_DIBLA|nr:unnamed protein product [Dibothriocephalus latus]
MYAKLPTPVFMMTLHELGHLHAQPRSASEISNCHRVFIFCGVLIDRFATLIGLVAYGSESEAESDTADEVTAPSEGKVAPTATSPQGEQTPPPEVSAAEEATAKTVEASERGKSSESAPVATATQSSSAASKSEKKSAKVSEKAPNVKTPSHEPVEKSASVQTPKKSSSKQTPAKEKTSIPHSRSHRDDERADKKSKTKQEEEEEEKKKKKKTHSVSRKEDVSPQRDRSRRHHRGGPPPHPPRRLPLLQSPLTTNVPGRVTIGHPDVVLDGGRDRGVLVAVTIITIIGLVTTIVEITADHDDTPHLLRLHLQRLAPVADPHADRAVMQVPAVNSVQTNSRTHARTCGRVDLPSYLPIYTYFYLSFSG